jgi:pimeloyl-ACP methyl ester carboxylesterase
MERKTITANGIDFSYLEEGEGPLVLLLHGFPDTATTWDALVPQIAAAGFRAVAPNTRGYAPTTPGEFYDSGTLATDARALIEALGAQSARVVGHDWGAATTYYLAAAFPDVVERAVTLALPHPIVIGGRLFKPQTIARVFHFWFFQMKDVPEIAVANDDFAFIDFLWKTWSPELDDAAHVREVKDALAAPGALPAALGYYRAMFDASKQDPATADVRAAIGTPIKTPVLTIIGTRDLGLGDPEELGRPFAGEFKLENLDGAGHFVHRERPDVVGKLVVDWLAR